MVIRERSVALRSPDVAEHDPEHAEIGRVPSREKAEEFCFGAE